MSSERMQYQPALDGVRALSVTVVLLFHGGISWMSGGYLGVSTFFTLSGFLITSLLIVEHERTGRIAAAAFYTRRARRLLPASLICISGVAGAAALGWFKGVPHVRRDALGALFQVFNWVKLGAGESYADLTAVNAGLRKPLEHYWSLAVEEQFYWIWPLVFVALVGLARRRRWSLLNVFVCLVAVFSVAAPVIARVWGADAAYWSTPARISEILWGALAAVWLAHRSAAGQRMSSRWSAAAPIALVLLVAACVLFPTGRGPAYHGALPLVGLVSAVLIVALQVPGRVREMLSWAPFASLGRISYGVYLYHWPVFVLVERQHWSAPVGVQLLAKCAITLAVAVVSYFLVEQRVRRSEWLVPRRTLVAALAGTAVVCAIAVVAPRADSSWAIDQGDASAASFGTETVAPLVTVPAGSNAGASTSSATGQSTGAPDTTGEASTVLPVPSRPVRIAVVGDSTAEAVGNGLVEWALAHPTVAKVAVAASRGCGLVMDGIVRLFGKPVVVADHCQRDVYATKAQKVVSGHPDVVMILATTWDVVDRSLEAGGPMRPPTDPAVRATIEQAYREYAQIFLAAGVRHVVFVRQPVPSKALAGDQPQTDRARHEVIFAAIDKVAAADKRVSVLDLDGWLLRRGLADNALVRPDGIHVVPPYSMQVAERFLGPSLVRVALT